MNNPGQCARIFYGWSSAKKKVAMNSDPTGLVRF